MALAMPVKVNQPVRTMTIRSYRHLPAWRMTLNLDRLPSCNMSWWKELLKRTGGAYDRAGMCKALLEYITSPGARASIKTEAKNAAFTKRLPKIEALLKQEIKKYEWWRD